MNASLTQYGFRFGPAEVTRMMADDNKGWVYIGIKSPKPQQSLEVYMTKTGKTRVYKNGVELT